MAARTGAGSSSGVGPSTRTAANASAVPSAAPAMAGPAWLTLATRREPKRTGAPQDAQAQLAPPFAGDEHPGAREEHHASGDAGEADRRHGPTDDIGHGLGLGHDPGERRLGDVGHPERHAALLARLLPCRLHSRFVHRRDPRVVVDQSLGLMAREAVGIGAELPTSAHRLLRQLLHHRRLDEHHHRRQIAGDARAEQVAQAAPVTRLRQERDVAIAPGDGQRKRRRRWRRFDDVHRAVQPRDPNRSVVEHVDGGDVRPGEVLGVRPSGWGGNVDDQHVARRHSRPLLAALRREHLVNAERRGRPIGHEWRAELVELSVPRQEDEPIGQVVVAAHFAILEGACADQRPDRRFGVRHLCCHRVELVLDAGADEERYGEREASVGSTRPPESHLHRLGRGSRHVERPAGQGDGEQRRGGAGSDASRRWSLPSGHPRGTRPTLHTTMDEHAGHNDSDQNDSGQSNSGQNDSGRIERAEVVVRCGDLGETLAFFVDQIGFRVDVISPADDPRVAVISGHGVRLRLEHDGAGGTPANRPCCGWSATSRTRSPPRGNCRMANSR